MHKNRDKEDAKNTGLRKFGKEKATDKSKGKKKDSNKIKARSAGSIDTHT
jgi:hypothetical protein